MDVREFDFYLPADLIAQEPSADRAAARLLHLRRDTGSISHSTVSALPDLLRAGDLVVVNDTRVFPARLLGHRVPSGGAVECLLVSRLGAGNSGYALSEITLHVGYGTVQPVRVDRVEDHRLEPESYDISAAAAGMINCALDERRRIIAVGTTTTRTLEAVARACDGRIAAGSGATDLFIYPGFEFRTIGGLLTNFHLPKSSLLMLVSAFAGRDRIRTAYDAAIAERYRFYSYGDAMLIL